MVVLLLILDLPFSCDNNALYEHFKDCGEITDAVVGVDHLVLEVGHC